MTARVRTAVFKLLGPKLEAAGLSEETLDESKSLIELGAISCETMYAWAIGNIIVDALRKRVRFLKHHANASAQRNRVLFLAIDVLAVQRDLAGDTCCFDRIVHPIQASEKRRFATT